VEGPPDPRRRLAPRVWAEVRAPRRVAGLVWGEVKSPLYRNAIFIMLSSIIGTGFGFFFWIIVTRVYTPEDAGYALTLVQTLSFLASIGTLGLGIGLLRFLPESDNPKALVNTALSISGAFGAVLALVFALGVRLWSPRLSFILSDWVYIPILVVTGMVYAFAPIVDQTVIALRRADLATWRNTVFSILKLPLPFVFVIWVTGPLGGRLGVYMSISLAFGVSVLVAGFLFLPRIIPGFAPRPRFSRRRVRPIFRFSIGNWVATTIASGAILLLPILILNTLADEAHVTYFYTAYTIAGLLYIIPGATMTSFLAEASQANSHHRRDERKAILLTLVLLAPGIAGIWLLSGVLLSLFGRPEYVAFGVAPLRILSLASIPVFLNGIFGTRVRIRKKTRPLIAAAAIEIAVTLGLGYVLLARSGLEGLAVAFVVGQAAATPLLWATAGAALETEPVEPTPVPP